MKDKVPSLRPGQGWHKERLRHSRARKYGKANVGKVVEEFKPHVSPKISKTIVEMSPSEFLREVPKPPVWDNGSLEYIEKAMKEGEDLGMPYLDYTLMYDGYPAHEGRHRAYVSRKLGIKKIKVVVYDWNWGHWRGVE